MSFTSITSSMLEWNGTERESGESGKSLGHILCVVCGGVERVPGSGPSRFSFFIKIGIFFNNTTV